MSHAVFPCKEVLFWVYVDAALYLGVQVPQKTAYWWCEKIFSNVFFSPNIKTAYYEKPLHRFHPYFAQR